LNSFVSRALALCLVLITGPCYAQTRALTESFDLLVGESRMLNNSNILIKFIAVENDGRCPIGATCVWGGDAEVKFEVSVDGTSHAMTLHTGAGHPDIMPKEFRIFGVTISLVKLAPYPNDGTAIGRYDYVATLSIS